MTHVPFVAVGRDLLKRQLVERAEHTAEWRTQKAEDHPDDAERNVSASEHLQTLAESLAEVGDDDPLWLAYACAVEDDNLALAVSEKESEELCRIGFSSFISDGREFLRRLLRVAEPALP